MSRFGTSLRALALLSAASGIAAAQGFTANLTVSPNPATVLDTIGLEVTLNAQLGGLTATFFDGTTSIGSATTDSFGTARLNVQLPAGNHTLTATIPVTVTVTSNAVTVVVRQNLTSSVNPSTYCSPVTFTWLPSLALAGFGNVTFTDGLASLGTVNVGPNGATVTTSTLTAGQHAINAVVGGSTWASLTQVVNRLTPSVTLVTAPNPSTSGQTVTMTATIGSCNASGTVSFFDNDIRVATVDVVNGVATFATANLTVGTHSIIATYSGDVNNNGAGSAAINQVVVRPTPNFTAAATPNPGSACTPVTLSATFPPATGGDFQFPAATGTVTFSEGRTILGTAAINNLTASVNAPLSGGTHTLTASYSGDGFYSASAVTFTEVVNPVNSTTSLTSSLNPSVVGQSVTFTASLTSCAGVTGTVTFLDGATTLGTATLSNGSASFTTSTLAVGTHPITARYGGDASNNPSTSNVVNQVVNRSGSSFTAAGTPNPATACQPVTLTATFPPPPPVVEGPQNPSATGTVTFREGNTVLGTATINNGAASVQVTLSGGTHNITASYGGDNFYSPATTTFTEVVNPVSSTISLISSQNPSVLTQPVTFTASITSCAAVTGTVTFLDGSTTLGTATLSNGSASFTTSTLALGTHPITAQYGGDANNSPSTSNRVDQVVNKGTVTVTVAGAPNPANPSQTIVVTANVAAGFTTSLVPGGTVTFTEGNNTLGTGTLTNGTTTLQLGAGLLGPGSHTITANYGGDAAFPSASASYVQLVQKISSTTTLTATPASTTFGTPVVLKATVAAAYRPPTIVPGGTVQFAEGGTVLGTAAVDQNANASLSVNLTAGTHNVTASFLGTSFVDVSTSQPVTIVVNKATTTTTLSLPSGLVIQSQPMTIGATVAPAAATGTVTFTDNGRPIGSATVSNGTATLTVNAGAPGQHSIVASYSGDNNFQGNTSQPGSVSVQSNATTVTIVAAPNPANFGQQVMIAAQMLPVQTGDVSFQEGPVTVGTAPIVNGTASINTSTLAVGTHDITAVVAGNGPFTGGTATVTVTVNKAPTTVSLNVPANVQPNQTVTLTARVGPYTATGTMTFADAGKSIGTANIVNGSASITTVLANGNHTLTAAYGGDASYLSSTSSVVQLAVGLAPVTLTITISPTAPQAGQDVTITAIVSPATATGTVTFGGDASGTATLENGSASVVIHNLSAGQHSFTATYAGNDAFASASVTTTVSIAKGTTTVSLSAAPSPVTAGQSVTLTATVTPAQATGTVTFADGGTTLGTGTLAGGTATFTTSTLAAGPHSLSATYAGDASFTGNTGSTSLTVNASTALSITAPPSIPDGTIGKAYPTQTFTATGGTPPYTWSLVSGSNTTSDLSIANSGGNGVLTGTPATAGTFQVVVQVKDSASPANTVSKPFTVTFAFPALPTITVSPTQISFAQGYPLATRGTLQLSFTPNAAALPANFVNPALLFAQNGQSSIQVDVPANATTVAIPAFQQGLIAGTVTVTLSGLTNAATGQAITPFPTPAPIATVTIPRSAPVIDPNSVHIVTSGGTSFSVNFNATSSTRDLVRADLTFAVPAGTQLSGAQVQVDLAAAGTAWFSSTAGQNAGASFSVSIPFTFSGDPKALPTSVSVTATNSAGTSTAVTSH